MVGEQRFVWGDVTILAGDVEGVTRPLAHGTETLLGRNSVWAGLVKETWVPRDLVRFEPANNGWMCHLLHGPSRVEGDHLEATVDQGGVIFLTSGSWRLVWIDLARRLEVLVEVTTSDRPRPSRRTPAHVDRARFTLGTTPPIRRSPIAEEDHALAVVFRHLLEHRPRPKGHLELVADELGMTTPQLRNWLHKRRERLERELAQTDRPLAFHDLDDFGRWLVEHRRIRREHLVKQGAYAEAVRATGRARTDAAVEGTDVPIALRPREGSAIPSPQPQEEP